MTISKSFAVAAGLAIFAVTPGMTQEETGTAEVTETTEKTVPQATDGATTEAPAATTKAANDVTADTVVATVGGVDITVGHMIVARTSLPEQYLQLPSEVLWDGILDQLIQQNALAAQYEGEMSRATKLLLENQRTGYLAGDVLEAAALGAVTDEALQTAYEAKFANAAPEKEFNAAHILVETEEEAKAVKEEIEAGGDFAEIAKVKSTGPSGPNGGALGWFSAGMMVPEFEAAVVALKPGEVSDPVKTQFGWHIILLNESRLKDTPPLEAVKGELTDELQRAAVDARIKAAVDAVEVVKSEAEIPASVLTQMDLLD